AKAALPASAPPSPPPSTTPSAFPARCASFRSRRSDSSGFWISAAPSHRKVLGPSLIAAPAREDDEGCQVDDNKRRPNDPDYQRQVQRRSGGHKVDDAAEAIELIYESERAEQQSEYARRRILQQCEDTDNDAGQAK